MLDFKTHTAYRSIRYSSTRKQTYTADSLPKFRLKRVSKFESTFNKTDAFKTVHTFNPEDTPTYLQTFQSLMGTVLVQPNTQPQPKHETISFLKGRVLLPNFNHEFEDRGCSEFTLLDVFHRPYQAVKKVCDQVEKQLKQDASQLEEIRFGLQSLSISIQTRLQAIQDDTLRSLEYLRGLLRKNQTGQHEKKLRNKRELSDLQQQDSSNRQVFKSVTQRGEELQLGIFSCKPFELTFEDPDQLTEGIYF